jgi:hypothetical protein
MAAIAVRGPELVVTLERNERWWGLLSNLRVPLSAISAVEVVPDGRRAVRGLRAPGLGGPQRLIGTWRAKGNRQYVCVRRGQPALKITLGGQRYRTVLVGAEKPEPVAAELRSAAAL